MTQRKSFVQDTFWIRAAGLIWEERFIKSGDSCFLLHFQVTIFCYTKLRFNEIRTDDFLLWNSDHYPASVTMDFLLLWMECWPTLHSDYWPHWWVKSQLLVYINISKIPVYQSRTHRPQTHVSDVVNHSS